LALVSYPHGASTRCNRSAFALRHAQQLVEPLQSSIVFHAIEGVDQLR
jgi:hypothetical protein